jgi:hypothetical protein
MELFVPNFDGCVHPFVRQRRSEGGVVITFLPPLSRAIERRLILWSEAAVQCDHKMRLDELMSADIKQEAAAKLFEGARIVFAQAQAARPNWPWGP